MLFQNIRIQYVREDYGEAFLFPLSTALTLLVVSTRIVQLPGYLSVDKALPDL